MKKIYKYISHNVLELIFTKKDYCGLKFSYPKDYNDPYELFLTIDFKQNEEMLAFYKEAIGEIPQYPTTCFSNSPLIIPMWAHYGNNHEGFVLEIDINELNKFNNEYSLINVNYTDYPNPIIQEKLEYAFYRGKPRDMYFFWNAIEYAAYSNKQKCWDYEKETRLVIKNEKLIDNNNGHMIFNIPSKCVTSIIAGSKVKDSYLNKAELLTKELNINFFTMKIGKSNSTPYLIKDNKTYVFDLKEIIEGIHFCSKCNEPIEEFLDKCGWCKITEKHLEEASFKNPMNLLGQAGILESYLAMMNSVRKK
ncbi:DUF2971 domain-containing protein [Aliarcobacter skirrowii]|uniref:DUF2971 domain-containing protein n=1 Tax=Aliarcobacter skirrowii TaxID=28200 RepID=UPI0029B041A4|nr:DUF2971 domain-containing protein [Aliarcobacter skirrowii]MDX4063886.1 DUF2971 domain-containing protein [Aliarcobacter skirrowii]